MSRTYRVQRFAALAGVTVKTLHHYDRIGLLRPLRTPAGYRVYCESDLPRLAQIAALKLAGIRLKEIGPLLEGESRSLDEILRAQRHILQSKRESIGRVIEAIDEALRTRLEGKATDADVLRVLIGAIEMQNNVDVLKDYFEPDAWSRWRAAHDEWPDAEWRDLLRDVEASLDIDPASPAAAKLAVRWNERAKQDAAGDTRVRVGFMKAWREWLVRPETRPTQFEQFDMDRILAFIVNAADAEHERRRLGSPETARVPPRVSRSRLALFHDVARVLNTNPAGDVGQEMARRYAALIDAEAGGDPETVAEMQHACTTRAVWPAGALRWIASTYDMDPDTWTAVANFLDAASVSSGGD